MTTSLILRIFGLNLIDLVAEVVCNDILDRTFMLYRYAGETLQFIIVSSQNEMISLNQMQATETNERTDFQYIVVIKISNIHEITIMNQSIEEEKILLLVQLRIQLVSSIYGMSCRSDQN